MIAKAEALKESDYTEASWKHFKIELSAAKAVLEALLDMYSNEGVQQIEDTQVLKLDPFVRMGKPAALVKLFGGKDGYLKAVRELENEIYKVV